MRTVPRVSARVVFAGGLVAIVLGAGVVAQQRAAAAMPRVAAAFLASLTPEQRAKASFDVKSDELTRWNFVPAAQFPRSGLALREMTDPQRTLAHDLLKLGLSQRGYLQASTIMDLENLLHEIEGGKGPAGPNGWPYRDPGQVLRLDFRRASAHRHLGMARRGASSVDPLRRGDRPCRCRARRRSSDRTRPRCVRAPKTGSARPGWQEDAARALLDALDRTESHGDLRADAAGRDRHADDGQRRSADTGGLMASAMTPAQRDLLIKIIEAYTGAMADDVAADRMEKVIAAGIEKVGFAWAGRVERGASAPLPRAGPDVPHRAQQHAEQRQPRALGLARLRRRLRPRSARRALGGRAAPRLAGATRARRRTSSGLLWPVVDAVHRIVCWREELLDLILDDEPSRWIRPSNPPGLALRTRMPGTSAVDFPRKIQKT